MESDTKIERFWTAPAAIHSHDSFSLMTDATYINSG